METWHSRFDYHGFQYVEVTGFPGKPTLDTLRGVFIHSAIPVAGEFECSNPLLNKIWRAGRWAYLSNLQGIPTDCPHREKNGWTGDAHLAAEQGLLNYAPAAVYTKWINDLGDEQRPDAANCPASCPPAAGATPGATARPGTARSCSSRSTSTSIAATRKVLCDHYDGMKRYVDYLTSKAKDGIVDIGLNDWAPFKTSHAGGHHLHGLLLPRRPDRGAHGGLDGERSRCAQVHRTGGQHQAGVQREVLPPRHRPLRQRQPDLAQLRALPGPGRTGEQGARAQQPGGGGGEDATATLTPASSGRNTC